MLCVNLVEANALINVFWSQGQLILHLPTYRHLQTECKHPLKQQLLLVITLDMLVRSLKSMCQCQVSYRC